MSLRALFDTPIMTLVLPLLLVMVAGLVALAIRGMMQMRRASDSTTIHDKSAAEKVFRRAA